MNESRNPDRPRTGGRRPPSSIGALVFCLVLLGALVLVEQIRNGGTESTAPVAGPGSADGAGAVTTAGLPVETAPPVTAPPPTVAGEWPTGDPSRPVALAAPAPIPMPPSSQFASTSLRLEPTVDLSNVTGMVWNDRIGAYYAITQGGTVHRVDRDLTRTDLVLDLRGEVTELAVGSERGLLGIAFDPRDGRMFLYFTDRGDDTHVISMAMVDGIPDLASRREVLFVEQPGLGHKAGDLVFEPAGHLYVALGDGGGSRGRDAQDNTKLLGKIIRITPKIDGNGYDVPADNPFVGRSDVRPEIWASGLRNPWQIWRNPANGEWYVGDVGESDIEELNYIPPGASGVNFGWPWYEGSNTFAIGEKPDGVEVTQPIFEYPHSEGVAIITGAIYHGNAIPALRGAFVFADMTGSLYALGSDEAERIGGRAPGVATTFVETPDGEFLVTSLEDGVLRVLPG